MCPAGGSDLESSHPGKPRGPGQGAGFGLGLVLTPSSCFITLNSTAPSRLPPATRVSCILLIAFYSVSSIQKEIKLG